MEIINLMDMKIKDKKFKKLLNDLKYLHQKYYVYEIINLYIYREINIKSKINEEIRDYKICT